MPLVDATGRGGAPHGWSHETRTRILDAGIAELRARGLRPGVAHIRLADVTERAGVSLAIAYRIWSGSRTRDGLGGQDRFHRDLVAEAFRRILTDYPALVAREGNALLDSGASFDELIRVTATTLYEGLSEDRTGIGIVLGLYGATLADPELRAVAAESHQRAVDDFTALLEMVLARYGREMADGLSVRDLTVAITALAAGFLIRDGVEPGLALRPVPHSVGTSPPGDWTLFGVGVWALTEGFTRPAAASPGSVPSGAGAGRVTPAPPVRP